MKQYFNDCFVKPEMSHISILPYKNPSNIIIKPNSFKYFKIYLKKHTKVLMLLENFGSKSSQTNFKSDQVTKKKRSNFKFVHHKQRNISKFLLSPKEMVENSSKNKLFKDCKNCIPYQKKLAINQKHAPKGFHKARKAKKFHLNQQNLFFNFFEKENRRLKKIKTENILHRKNKISKRHQLNIHNKPTKLGFDDYVFSPQTSPNGNKVIHNTTYLVVYLMKNSLPSHILYDFRYILSPGNHHHVKPQSRSSDWDNEDGKVNKNENFNYENFKEKEHDTEKIEINSNEVDGLNARASKTQTTFSNENNFNINGKNRYFENGINNSNDVIMTSFITSPSVYFSSLLSPVLTPGLWFFSIYNDARVKNAFIQLQSVLKCW